MADDAIPVANAAEFFSFDREGLAIHTAMARHVGRATDAFAMRYLPPENLQRYAHGGSWEHPGADDVRDSGMRDHKAESGAQFDAIVDHDLKMIADMVASLNGQLNQQFAQMMFGTVEEAAESVGNVVDAAGQAPEEAYYQMLEKIEVRANPDFSIRWPTQIAGAGATERLEAAMNGASDAFKAKLEALKEAKAAEAREREAARQARFKRYGR